MCIRDSFNYERMQAAGWLYCILPGLEKIHADNKEDLELSMEHNLEFFNTHPFLVTFVMGIILSLEQQKADIETIRAVRVAAMGPLGGIGDAIFWFTLVPITAGITSNMAINGSLAGPIMFLLIFNIVQFACRFFLMYWSYNLGTKACLLYTSIVDEFDYNRIVYLGNIGLKGVAQESALKTLELTAGKVATMYDSCLLYTSRCV